MKIFFTGPVLVLVMFILGGCQTLPPSPLQPDAGLTGAVPPESVPPPGPSGGLSGFSELNDLGVHLLREGHQDDAFIQFQKALVLNPEYARARFNLALVYYRKGLFDREIEEYQKAIEIEPDYFHAHLNLAHAYLSMGRMEDATKEYQWILRKDPNHRKALYNLAVILMDQRKIAEAASLFKRYLKLEPKGPWAGKANKYLQEGLKGGRP